MQIPVRQQQLQGLPRVQDQGTEAQIRDTLERQVRDDSQAPNNPHINQSEIKIKNKLIPILSALIMSISSFQFGWAFCQVSTIIPINILIDAYHMPVSSGTAHSILIGILPAGGAIGCILYTFLLKLLSRRHSVYAIIVLDLIAFILIQINTFPTVVISRFLLGIVMGLYTTIGPLIIRQVTPKAMRPLLGSFFSLGRSIGIVACYLLGVILYVTNCPQYYRIMFSFPAIFAIIQGIGIFFIVPDSPIELVAQQKEEKAKKVLSKIYEQQSIQLVYKQIQNELNQSSKNKSEEQQQDPLRNNKLRALLMSIHLNIYRNFMGINAVVAYAGLIVDSIDKLLSPYAGLIVNGVQLIFVIFSTFYLGSRLGRRFFWLSSCVILAICCLVIGIGEVYSRRVVVLVFIMAYMIMFGILVTPVLWSYPIEIIPPSQVGVTVMITWIALAVTVILPPLIIQQMPGNNPYPLFFFFGGYMAASFIYMWFFLAQNKGLTYLQTIQKF